MATISYKWMQQNMKKLCWLGMPPKSFKSWRGEKISKCSTFQNKTTSTGRKRSPEVSSLRAFHPVALNMPEPRQPTGMEVHINTARI